MTLSDIQRQFFISRQTQGNQFDPAAFLGRPDAKTADAETAKELCSAIEGGLYQPDVGRNAEFIHS